MTTRTRSLLLILLLLGFGLRLVRLGDQSLWYDEGVTAAVSQQGLADLARWTADDIQPPLYYVLVAGWTQVAGTSEYALRFPSLAAGLLGLALLYAVSRRLWGDGPRSVAGPAARRGRFAVRHMRSLTTVYLAAIAPLWVYYAQEARNYALLTTLCLLVAYLLLRVLDTDADATRRLMWTALALAAAAALYTHYFALFFLLAMAVYAALVLWWTRQVRRPARTQALLREGAAAGLGSLLLFAPWLPFLLNRYQVDRSFWEGPFKLGEALRHLAVNVTLGAPEMVLEGTAVRLLLGWGAVLLVALIGLAMQTHQTLRKREAWLHLLFLTCYLFLPLLAILALAYRTPKFNPRYLMMVTPAFFLLLGAGLSQRRVGRMVDLSYTALALLLVTVTSVYALTNWYTNPLFAKADWRGVAAYVRSHWQPGDVVVLVSGHAYPIWHYYAPDLEPLRLPNIDVLDVNQVLGYSIAPTLQAGLAGHRGVWLVLWQDNVVDPVGYAADFLVRVGRETAVPLQFSQVGLRHFALPPDAQFSDQPPLSHPLTANLGGLVDLLGWSRQPCADAPCPVRLEWRARQNLNVDLKLAGEILTAEGQLWQTIPDRRLSAYDYPSTRWTPGTVVFGLLPLDLWQGTPPGDYRLNLRVYAAGGGALDLLDAAGNPAGQTVELAPVAVADLVRSGPQGPPAPANALGGAPLEPALAAAPGIALQRFWLTPRAAETGDLLTLALFWQTGVGPVTQDYRLRAAWWSPLGVRVETALANPGGEVFPTSIWPAGSGVLSQIAPRVPLTATTGSWTLRIELVDARGQAAGDGLSLPVAVAAGEHAFTLPTVQRIVGVRFGDSVRLVGADISPGRLAPGQDVQVRLVWQALSTPDADWTAFVQLLDAQGALVVQDNHPPAARGSSAWLPDEVISSVYDLTIPVAQPAGEYRLIAGLYDPARAGLPRVSVRETGLDYVDLGRVEVVR